MGNVLVSIIVPVFNTAGYLEESIGSILSQSYKNIELVLVNDGSTDGSAEICNFYERLPNVRYLEQENRGTTAARRRGVEAANGEWIMFVDSDDLLMKEAIAGMVHAAGSAEIVIGEIKDSHNFNDLPDRLNRQRYLEMQYARELSASPCAKLFKRDLFDDNTLSFSRHLNRGEDYLMNLMLAINNQKDVRVYKHQVYQARENLNSTCHTYPFTLDYMTNLSKMGDAIVKYFIPTEAFLRQRVKQRMYFFCEALRETRYVSDSQHPFVMDTKRCMDEAKEWRPLDRLMLSVSSPLAVKTVWNLRKVAMRIQHPSMIARDFKRISTKYLKVH